MCGADDNNVRSYAVVSIVADTARFSFIGTTVFDSEVTLRPIADWGLDALIEDRMRVALIEKTGKRVVIPEYDRPGLASRAYVARDASKDLPDDMKPNAFLGRNRPPPTLDPNFDAVRAELQAISRKVGAEVLVLAVKRRCVDSFAHERNFLGQRRTTNEPLNGFGLYAYSDFHNDVNDFRRRALYLCAGVWTIDATNGEVQRRIAVRGLAAEPGPPFVMLDRAWKFRPKDISEAQMQELRAHFESFVPAIGPAVLRLLEPLPPVDRVIPKALDR